jgi:hypothetical protein
VNFANKEMGVDVQLFHGSPTGRVAGGSGAGTTGKIAAAVQAIIAVSRCTANKSLPCGASRTHGKDVPHGNDF